MYFNKFLGKGVVMGFIGKKKFPFPGEVVDFIRYPNMLMSCQRDGRPWPSSEVCSACWYIGERVLYSGRKGDELQLIQHNSKKRVLYFSNHDQKVPHCVRGFLCLSGIKTLEDALMAPEIVAPDKSRCHARTSQEPEYNRERENER